MRAIVIGAVAAVALGIGPDPVRTAIRALVAEADQYRSAPETLPAAPDYAARAPAPIEPDDLIDALTRRADRDRFADSYVRWQLSSLDPDLGALEPKVFARLVRQAPVLALCPRADPRIVELFEQVEAAGSLTPSDLEQMRELVGRLDADTVLARRLNTPSGGFAQWVQDKLSADALRSRQWLLVRLALTASAGWPVADLKRQVTKTLGGADNEPALSDRARALLARQARALVGLERRAVDQVTFMADGSVRVTFTISRITAKDVQKWLARLER